MRGADLSQLRDQLRDRIHAMNPLAKGYGTQAAAVPMERILDVGALTLSVPSNSSPTSWGESP